MKRSDVPSREPSLWRAWERQPEESAALYKVFVAYLSAQPRSVRKAVGAIRGRAPRTVPGNISRAAIAWRWHERAAKYDEERTAEERTAFELRRKRTRAARLGRLEALARKVREAGLAMDLRGAEPGVIVRALVELHREEREEFLDEAEDRRTDQEHRAAMPDLDSLLVDAPGPTTRPEPQKEEPS